MVGDAHLIEDVWGQDPPEDPRAALHTTVARVRRSLGPAGTLVIRRGAGYLLDRRSVVVDSEEFLELVTQARVIAHSADRVGILDQALELWRGAAWADLADDLAGGEARRLEEALYAAREDRAAALLEEGRCDAAVGDLRVLVAEQPLRERAVGLLMRSLHATGDVGQALAAYETHRETLADELGLDPSAELIELHRQVLRRETDQPVLARMPTTRVAAPPPTGTAVAETTSGTDPRLRPRLHGREGHLEALRTMLELHRCVSIVGPGGVGKTSVALRLSQDAALRGGDRAGPGWWVDLASVGTPSGLRAAVARVLDVEVFPGVELADALLHRLGSAEGLLVLDNCEHLLEAAADLVSDALSAGEGVSVLVTSRTRLGVPQEQVFPLPPLQLPGAAQEALTQSPAVALFLERAAAVAPELDPDAASLAVVADLVRRLDGLPLAIELAAGRVGALTLEDLRDRLGGRLDLLRSTATRAASRHRTLTSTIAWSYDLLDPDERRVFLGVSVFATPFDLAAADAVLEEETADHVAGLVERSLLSRPGTSGRGHYRMLETLRSFARRRLTEEEGTRLARSHARWAAERAEVLAEGVTGPDEARWAAEIEVLIPEMAAAARWSTTSGEPAYAVRIVTALHNWAYHRVRADVLAWVTDVLALDIDEVRTPDVYSVASAHAWVAGRPQDGLQYANRALGAAGGPQTPAAITALLAAGDCALSLGDLIRVYEYNRGAYRLAVAEGQWMHAALGACGMLLARTFAGQPTRHELALTEEAMRRADNPSTSSLALYCLGEAVTESDPPHALSLFTEAVKVSGSVGGRLGASVALIADSALRGRVGPLDADTVDRTRQTLEHWSRQAHDDTLLVTALRNTVPLLDRLGAHRAAVEVTASTSVNAPTRPPYGAEATRLEDVLERARVGLGAPGFDDAWASGSRRTVIEACHAVLGELARLRASLSVD
jgi:predicted ATPase/DNA-binding SARP family transcriptional activator